MTEFGLPPLPRPHEFFDTRSRKQVGYFTEAQLLLYGASCRLQALRDAAKECEGAANAGRALEAGLREMGHPEAARLEMAYRMAAEHCEQAITWLAECDFIEGKTAKK